MAKKGITCIQMHEDYEVGSLPPSGYGAWINWQGVQHRGGLRQARCPRCKKWNYPQELCLKEGICSALESD